MTRTAERVPGVDPANHDTGTVVVLWDLERLP
jgi:hypothetical protein